MADLAYSSNIGCASSKDSGGPGQCTGRQEFAVPHRDRYPRPRKVRLFVCAHHARKHHTAEPLTVEDRRVIAERRARRDEVLARVTVRPYARPRQVS